MSNIYYKPKDAWAADFIPFHKDGELRLFYLKDWRNAEQYGEGTPWYQISTSDFVNYIEHGEMLPRGTKEEQDLYVYTGSVIEAGGLYHIYYTGHNPHFRKEDIPEQGIMHAISKDLVNWQKVSEDTFYAPHDTYEPHDWRDPFVFWNEEAEEYWMLLAARVKIGPSRRRGCTALCASKDLKKWEVKAHFWAPGLYYTHECPDLFKIGDWWYLVYSTFTERFVTHYRMSKSLKGPWLAPDNDTFDGRAFYAAKTCSDGNKRFIFGWNPTCNQEKDYGNWEWGGNLVVHEVVQETDGALSVRVPETIDKTFSKHMQIEFTEGLGKWEKFENCVIVEAPGTFACAIEKEMPRQCRISMDITFGKNTRGCGVMFKVSDDFEQAYYIRLEPLSNRLVFDSWPRMSRDIPFMLELERPIELIPEKVYHVKAIVEGTICEVYVDKKVAMSTRIYDGKPGKWGVFINEGNARFDNITLTTI